MKVITGKVRAAYVHVFKPYHNKFNNKEMYKLTAIIPKSDKETLKKIKESIEAAIAKKWPDKKPTNLRMPLKDGDNPEHNPSEQPFFKDCFFLEAKTQTDAPPAIIDKNKLEVLDPTQFVSGDYCRISIYPYAYSQNGNNGVSFYLNNIQVLEKGETLSGRARAEDEFDSWDVDDDDSVLSQFG